MYSEKRKKELERGKPSGITLCTVLHMGGHGFRKNNRNLTYTITKIGHTL